MMLLRSAPRQAYRIYSEEEFLAAEDWQVEGEPEFATLGQARPRRESKRWGGLAALAALASVAAAVAGVVALNATRTKPQSNRRIAARGGSPPKIIADRLSIRSPGAPPRTPTRRASVLVRRITGSELRPAGRSPITAHPHRPPQPTPSSATAFAPTAATSATIPATPSTTAFAPTAATSATIPATPSTTASAPTAATPATIPATPSTIAPTTTAPNTAATTAVAPATPTAATASTPVAATAVTATTPTAGGADAEFGFEQR